MNLEQEMHDLSQPLTRLQWRLELAKLTGDDAELRDTLAAALQDVGELMERVRQLRAKADDQARAKTDHQARTKTEQQQELAGRVA
jgi:signal transduction histidine kinase